MSFPPHSKYSDTNSGGTWRKWKVETETYLKNHLKHVKKTARVEQNLYEKKLNFWLFLG